MIFDITDISNNVTWDLRTKSSDCDCDDCDGKLKFFDHKFRFFIVLQFLVTMKADGVCDDINNNEHCQYDGGDCCGHLKIQRYCFNCTCISNHWLFRLRDT